MDWKNQFTKTPVLIFFILLGAIGVGTASALITITLDGDVVITGDATLQGDLTCTDCIDSVEIEDNAVTPSKLSRFGQAAYPLTEQNTVGSERCILGEVRLFASTMVPKGWVPAEGQILQISQNSALYSLIGTIYGGDGRNDFQLPDLSEINPKSSLGNQGLNYAICTEGIFPGAENMIIPGDLLVEGQATVAGEFQVQGQADVVGAPIFSTRSTSEGNTSNLIIQRTEGSTAETPSFTLSHRTSDKDLWLYGFDGTTFKNFVGFDYPNYKVTFPADGNTLVVDVANDKVGIGTSNPTSKLHVNGDLQVDGTVIGDGTLGGLSCLTNQVSRWDGAQWVCSNIVGNLIESATTTVDAVTNVRKYTSIAIGNDGFPVISYFDDTNNFLKVAKCVNEACTGTSTMTAVATAVGGENRSIAIGNDGFPVISYYDVGSSQLKVAKCINESCTGTSTITAVNPTFGGGSFSAIAIGNDGFPVVGYLGSPASLKVAKCVNVSCTGTSTITTVDNTASVGYYTAIAIGNDGFPVISYNDSTNFSLKVAKCINEACTGTSTITAVDNTVFAGFYTSIAIGNDGFPVISYLDSTNSNLKVAKCVNVSCTGTSTKTTVDNTASVGYYTAIAIGNDGFPVISYYDGAANGDLKVAKCVNISCTGTSTITAVDTTGDVGEFTSIAIGNDGRLVISYLEGGAINDLKVFKEGGVVIGFN